MSKKEEIKLFGGHITEIKQEDRHGIKIGMVEGYIATWDLDRGNFFGVKDRFVRGAFLESIQEHRDKGNRPIRLKDHHGRTIGGFPIEHVFEDDRGLFGIGEINLEVQQGRDAWVLAKQGVLSDFSIGFSIDESTMDEQGEIRTIFKATIWEGSIVDEPMNPEANIVAVKSKFQDLPLAPKETEWDEEKALKSLEPYSDKTKQDAFIFLGKTIKGLQIAEFINGKLTVIPKAIENAAKVLLEKDFPEKENAIKHLEKYFAKMDTKSPFAEEQKQFFNIDEVKEFTVRQFEKSLAKSGCFSKEAATFLASKIELKEKTTEDPTDVINNKGNKEIIDQLKELTSLINKK